MTSDDQMFLGIFAALIVLSFVLVRRTNLAQLVLGLVRWGLIGVGIVIIGATWEDIQTVFEGHASVSTDGQEISIPQSFDGHYYLTLAVNGHPVRFLIDTGASDVVLSLDDARKAGIDLERLIFLGQAQTANGVVETAPVWLQTVGIGQMEDRNVRAVVNSGDLFGSLLGMGYLSRFDKITIENDTMTLRR